MKLVIVAAACLVSAACTASPAPADGSPARRCRNAPHQADPMNSSVTSGCQPVLRQVQEQSKRAEIRRGEARR
jgi:hypothetical protein